MHDSIRTDIADGRQLDRLVDGELAEGERRAVLHSLDLTPDGWKRCALAFLEAQAWRQTIGAPAQNVAAPPPRRYGHPVIARIAAVAAAVVIAFTVGILSGASWRPLLDREDLAEVERPGRHGQAPLAREVGRDRTTPGEVGRLRLPHASPLVQVPVVSVADADDAGELLNRPPVLPEYVRRQLERRGYEIEGNRELVSVGLADGRTVTIPVETLRYRFVGLRVH